VKLHCSHCVRTVTRTLDCTADNQTNSFTKIYILNFIILTEDGIIYSRSVQGLFGGLCGLASLYQALENTILTVSQLKQYNYMKMRATLAAEMGTNTSQTATLSDSALLDQFYAC
jgi:hypothetical protein